MVFLYAKRIVRGWRIVIILTRGGRVRATGPMVEKYPWVKEGVLFLTIENDFGNSLLPYPKSRSNRYLNGDYELCRLEG